MQIIKKWEDMIKIAHLDISAQRKYAGSVWTDVTSGGQWLETDIDMTSDGHLVLIHDK